MHFNCSSQAEVCWVLQLTALDYPLLLALKCSSSIAISSVLNASCILVFLYIAPVAVHTTCKIVCAADHVNTLGQVDWKVGLCWCRGHVDSVNDVCWQPFSSSLCTASSDKTVSIWDARSGLCTQTFYGHHNSCNCVAFNCQARLKILECLAVQTCAIAVRALSRLELVDCIRAASTGAHT